MIWKHKNSMNCEELITQTEQIRWICQDLSECTPDIGQRSLTFFDDRDPMRKGLTGAYQWNGLAPKQIVQLSKLKFWFTKDFISGFQATYIINGIPTIGPRNRFENKHCVHYSRIFELNEGENISCVQAIRHFNGPIVRLSIVTDRGRSCSMGMGAGVIQTKPETLLRHPDARVVGFRGSFEQGLTGFGFVLEVDETNQDASTEGYKCYICGVLCSYFKEMRLFWSHIDICVLQSVSNQQEAEFPFHTIASHVSNPNSYAFDDVPQNSS